MGIAPSNMIMARGGVAVEYDTIVVKYGGFMWFDNIKKKAKDFYNKNINPKPEPPEAYLVEHKADKGGIDTLKKLSKVGGISVENIKYTAPNGKVMYFETPEKLEAYLNREHERKKEKEDEDELDLNSIGDKPKDLTTVYGDCRKRNTKQCPHCGYVFDEPPTRGKKCPKCGNQFYVRVGNRLFASDLLKPQDAIAADCFSNMLNMPDFNITVEFAKKILESRRRSYPVEPASRDVIWDIMRKFPDTLSSNPLEMIKATERLNHLVAMYENDCGRDPRSLLETKIENNITYCEVVIMQNNLDQDYLYVSSNCCCDVCRSRHGKKVKIKDAKEKMPIPFKDCQNKLHPKDKHNFCMAEYTWCENHQS